MKSIMTIRDVVGHPTWGDKRVSQFLKRNMKELHSQAFNESVEAWMAGAQWAMDNRKYTAVPRSTAESYAVDKSLERLPVRQFIKAEKAGYERFWKGQKFYRDDNDLT